MVAPPLLGVTIPKGSLACVLTPISSTNCRTAGGAGILEAYLIPFSDIDEITWDTNEQATAITLVASKTWTKFGFEKDTAFLNQEKQLNGTALNFVQTLQMLFPNNDFSTRKALQDLDQCCDIVGLVVDNQQQQHLVGVLPRYNAAGDTIIGTTSLSFKTGAGSYNTGANPSSDQNVRTLSLVGNAGKEAPYTSIDVTALSLTP